MKTALLCLLLIGCAAPTFDKPGASADEMTADSETCRMRSLNSPMNSKRETIYLNCMRSKGWKQATAG